MTYHQELTTGPGQFASSEGFQLRADWIAVIVLLECHLDFYFLDWQHIDGSCTSTS